MKKIIFLFAAAITSLAFLTVHAQEVKDFSLVNVVNGKTVSLSTYPSCAGIVVLFTSNACPYDEYYRGRIDKLAREYQDKVPVMLVNSHNDPNESIDNMKKKGAGWSLPYLADKDQVLMTSLGVAKSPSAYLLKNNGGKFVLIYSGAIDDNAQVEADVRHHHLKDAIDIMLANQKVATAEVRPAGCSIRKK